MECTTHKDSIQNLTWDKVLIWACACSHCSCSCSLSSSELLNRRLSSFCVSWRREQSSCVSENCRQTRLCREETTDRLGNVSNLSKIYDVSKYYFNVILGIFTKNVHSGYPDKKTWLVKNYFWYVKLRQIKHHCYILVKLDKTCVPSALPLCTCALCLQLELFDGRPLMRGWCSPAAASIESPPSASAAPLSEDSPSQSEWPLSPAPDDRPQTEPGLWLWSMIQFLKSPREPPPPTPLLAADRCLNSGPDSPAPNEGFGCWALVVRSDKTRINIILCYFRDFLCRRGYNILNSKH